jgi:hypothetical protein
MLYILRKNKLLFHFKEMKRDNKKKEFLTFYIRYKYP